MEHHQELLQQAQRHFTNADYGLRFTYRLVTESTVLLSVLQHTFLAGTSAMGSLLHYELKYKRIPPFEETFEGKFRAMKQRVAEQRGVETSYLHLLREMKEMIVAHKTSPVEFTRGDRLIICNDSYDMKEVSPRFLEEALAKTKLFIDEVTTLTE